MLYRITFWMKKISLALLQISLWLWRPPHCPASLHIERRRTAWPLPDWSTLWPTLVNPMDGKGTPNSRQLISKVVFPSRIQPYLHITITLHVCTKFSIFCCKETSIITTRILWHKNPDKEEPKTFPESLWFQFLTLMNRMASIRYTNPLLNCMYAGHGCDRKNHTEKKY